MLRHLTGSGDLAQWEESGCGFGLDLTGPRESLHFLSPPTSLCPDDHGSLSFPIFEHFRMHKDLADS